MGDLSEHFNRSEFRCRCPRNHDQFTPPIALLVVLEIMRRDAGHKPLRIVSGFRCPAHNAEVGGVASSQHLAGRAVDIPDGYVTVAEAAAAGAQGIGDRDGWAVHVDVRPGGPARWSY